MSTIKAARPYTATGAALADCDAGGPAFLARDSRDVVCELNEGTS